jgi:hypothetical protein
VWKNLTQADVDTVPKHPQVESAVLQRKKSKSGGYLILRTCTNKEHPKETVGWGCYRGGHQPNCCHREDWFNMTKARIILEIKEKCGDSIRVDHIEDRGNSNFLIHMTCLLHSRSFSKWNTSMYCPSGFIGCPECTNYDTRHIEAQARRLKDRYLGDEPLSFDGEGKRRVGLRIIDTVKKTFEPRAVKVLLLMAEGREYREYTKPHGFEVDAKGSLGLELDLYQQQVTELAFQDMGIKIPIVRANVFAMVKKLDSNPVDVVHLDLCGPLTGKVTDCIARLVSISGKGKLIFVTTQEKGRGTVKHQAAKMTGSHFAGARVLWRERYEGVPTGRYKAVKQHMHTVCMLT